MDARPFQECKFSVNCWRHYYTIYLLSNKNIDQIPTRMDLVISGIAPANMVQGLKGVWMKSRPSKFNGRWLGLCPAFLQYTVDLKENCEEYRREENIKNPGKKRYKMQRSFVSQKTRTAVAEKSGWCCVYCHRNINTKMINPGRHCTKKRIGGVIDHFIPISRGGLDEFDNLVLACWECNSMKSADIWELGCRKGQFIRIEE